LIDGYSSGVSVRQGGGSILMISLDNAYQKCKQGIDGQSRDDRREAFAFQATGFLLPVRWVNFNDGHAK
jgi:hypothetical protein